MSDDKAKHFPRSHGGTHDWGDMNKRTTAVCLATAAFLTLTACGGSSQVAHAPSPNASKEASVPPSPSVPTPSPPIATAEVSITATPTPSIDSLKIPTGLSDEETAKKLVAAFSNWSMAGATQEASDNELTGSNVTLTQEEYANKIAAEQSVSYAKALLPQGYESNPALLKIKQDSERNNAANIVAFLSSSGGPGLNPVNIEPWKHTIVEDKLVNSVVNGQTRTLTINATEKDNGAKNFAGETKFSNFPSQINVTITTSGDHEVITSLQMASR